MVLKRDKKMKKLLSFLCVFVFCFILATEANSQNPKGVSGAEIMMTFRDASGSEFSIQAFGRGKLRVVFPVFILLK